MTKALKIWAADNYKTPIDPSTLLSSERLVWDTGRQTPPPGEFQGLSNPWWLATPPLGSTAKMSSTGEHSDRISCRSKADYLQRLSLANPPPALLATSLYPPARFPHMMHVFPKPKSSVPRRPNLGQRANRSQGPRILWKSRPHCPGQQPNVPSEEGLRRIPGQNALLAQGLISPGCRRYRLCHLAPDEVNG